MTNLKTKKLNTKMGKQLIKGLNEAVADAKAKKSSACSSSGLRSNKWVCEDKSYPSFEAMIEDWRKKEKERWNKLTPEQKKKETEKKKAKALREKIKEQKRQEKYAKQRAKNGFCDEDTWSVDYWFCNIVPKILRQLGNDMHGWQPYLGYTYCSKTKEIIKTKKEITFKEHQQVVLKLADMIEDIIVDDPDDKRWNNKALGYDGDYNTKLKDKALTIFKDIFFSLWD